MAASTADLRSYYARLVTGKAGANDPRLIAAFAAVERERFVGPGPWKVMAHASGYIDTPTDDAAFLYQDVVVALVADRQINNGEPHLHARCLAALDIQEGETAVHVGCGTGYYTAILAQLVGSTGRVVAYELDQGLARRAEANLANWPQVVVRDRSGTDGELPLCDIIYVSAGATRPLDAWLDALGPSGRLLFPLTPSRGLGGLLLITRAHGACFDARFVQPAAFIPCNGARDQQEAEQLSDTFARGAMYEVKSLHRGTAPDGSAWFAGRGWWLSMRANAGPKTGSG
jgi:protein-L-isoaspartate(D-aspartate) O-methyltransferase